jgi:drug/metabolite transporter (DMT)-like permease
MKKEMSKAYIALAIVSFFWGTTYIAAKIGAKHMPGLFIAGVRQFLSGLLLVGFYLLKGHRIPDWKTLRKVSIQGILLLCIANGLLTWSLQYITSGLAAIITGLVPLFIALFSILVISCVKFTKWMVVGLVVGFSGILTIFYEYLHQLVNPVFAFGVLLAFIATLSWSFGTVYASKYKVSLELLFAVGLQMLIAGVILLPICYFTGQYVNLVTVSGETWLSILYLVVFGSLLAYSAFVFAVSKLPATQVSVYAYINPIVAIALGGLLLQEKMTMNVVTGTLITLAGVYLVNREFKKQQLR